MANYLVYLPQLPRQAFTTIWSHENSLPRGTIFSHEFFTLLIGNTTYLSTNKTSCYLNVFWTRRVNATARASVNAQLNQFLRHGNLWRIIFLAKLRLAEVTGDCVMILSKLRLTRSDCVMILSKLRLTEVTVTILSKLRSTEVRVTILFYQNWN